MASKNTKCSPTQSNKFAFVTKTKSNSFPRALREEASIPNAKLKHTSSSSSLTFTYTSVKDLIPFVKSPRRSSPLSKDAFSPVQSAEDIAISNFLVQKAAWAYLQPMPKTTSTTTTIPSSNYSWGHIWNNLKSPMNSCLRFINRNIAGKITHALDMVLRAISVV